PHASKTNPAPDRPPDETHRAGHDQQANPTDEQCHQRRRSPLSSANDERCAQGNDANDREQHPEHEPNRSLGAGRHRNSARHGEESVENSDQLRAIGTSVMRYGGVRAATSHTGWRPTASAPTMSSSNVSPTNQVSDARTPSRSRAAVNMPGEGFRTRR